MSDFVEQTRRKRVDKTALRREFKEVVWPKLCEDQRKYVREMFLFSQSALPGETKENFEVRTLNAVTTAMKRFAEKYEESYTDWVQTARKRDGESKVNDTSLKVEAKPSKIGASTPQQKRAKPLVEECKDNRFALLEEEDD